ncbi:MAG TPA: hypothetical protein VN904_00230 [Chthoniobacterales bacterium]|nr:hypothetical protein [Chthoniobacterales bacterium]
MIAQLTNRKGTYYSVETGFEWDKPDTDMTDEQKKIASLVLEYGTIRGFELKKHFEGRSDAELVVSIKPLVDRNLITASSTVTPDTLNRIQFAALTSTRQAFL